MSRFVSIIVFISSFVLLTVPLALAGGSQCQLNLSLNTISGNAAQSGAMTYTLVARDAGQSDCLSASISLYYAPHESLVSAAPRATALGYYWELGTLAAGTQATITLTTNRNAALAPGDATNEACLSADNGADSCADAAVAAPAAAAPITPVPAPAPAVAPTPVPALAPAPIPVAPAPVVTVSASSNKKRTPPPPTPTPAPQEFGVWVWNALTQMSGTTQMQQIVNEAAANGFNAIYLTIDDYLTIDAMSAGAAKTAALANYNQLAGEFLSYAAAKNIAVDAEAGWRDWGYPSNRWKPTDIISFVANYNANAARAGASTSKFRGVQYDVEPYLLPEYSTDPATVLTQYLQMVENLVNQDKALGAAGTGVPLSFDIPHFYDDVVAWAPQVTLDGITAYPYNHLLRLMNQLPAATSGLPQGTLLIMAYRNFATGANSTVALAQTEVSEADATAAAGGAGVKVIVGQETGPVTPSYVTFYGTSKSYFNQQVGIVKQNFAADKSFGGIAVDYLDPFLLLQ